MKPTKESMGEMRRDMERDISAFFTEAFAEDEKAPLCVSYTSGTWKFKLPERWIVRLWRRIFRIKIKGVTVTKTAAVGITEKVSALEVQANMDALMDALVGALEAEEGVGVPESLPECITGPFIEYYKCETCEWSGESRALTQRQYIELKCPKGCAGRMKILE